MEDLLTGKAQTRGKPKLFCKAEDSDSSASRCLEHLSAFLSKHQDDPDRLSWTLIELRDKFPVSGK